MSSFSQIEIVGPVGEYFHPNSSQVLRIGMPAARHNAIYSKIQGFTQPLLILYLFNSPNHCERLIAYSMTMNTATRIVLHSAEVVHFTHKSTYDSNGATGWASIAKIISKLDVS